MLKLTVVDILRQRTFASIAIISGLILGVTYYFLTLDMALTHVTVDIELLPAYMIAVSYTHLTLPTILLV